MKNNFVEMSNEELKNKLASLKEEYLNLRFKLSVAQLENTSQVKLVKRDIARIYTILQERKLDIRKAPVVEEKAVKAKKSTKKA